MRGGAFFNGKKRCQWVQWKLAFKLPRAAYLMQNDNKITFFQKTDRCNYLEYSGDAVLVIYTWNEWWYQAIGYACKAILTIMWCNQNKYNEQGGTTKDWLFPFIRLEAIVSGVSVISDFPINYRLAVIGGEEGLVDDANAKILAAL